MRKHVLARHGAIASSAIRAPGTLLSDTAVAEIERLLTRLARHDPDFRL